MKRIILSLVVASGLLMANVDENKGFCAGLNASMPSIAEIGLDTFAIRDGKTSQCEDHSKEEWQDLLVSAEYSFLMALNYSVPSVYSKLVSKAIESKTNDLAGLQKLLEDGALHGEFIDATKSKDKI